MSTRSTTTLAPTLTRIAQLAGCSKATASVVLNKAKGNITVGSELRQRVLDVANELGYHPDYASRSLALRRTQALGIFVPPVPWGGIGSQYEGAMLRGAELVCLEQGYQLLLLNVAGKARPELCLHNLLERRIDGLLVLRADGNEQWLKELTQRSAAVIAVDCVWPHEKLNAVMFDTQAAVNRAIEHLRSLGHERIGYVGRCTQRRVAHNEARREAYRKAMAAAGIEPDESWIFDQPCDSEDASEQHGRHHAAAHFMAMGASAPTAVLAYNDHTAAAMVQSYLAAGRRLPEAMSIITVEDTPVCRYLTPRLTAVHHPLEQMGRIAAERLIARARGRADDSTAPQTSDRVTWCGAELHVRESTAPPDVDREGDAK